MTLNLQYLLTLEKTNPLTYDLIINILYAKEGDDLYVFKDTLYTYNIIKDLSEKEMQNFISIYNQKLSNAKE